MKNLIAIILFLVGITAHAANPSMAQLNFASNSLVAQIIAAQAWTRTNGWIIPINPTNDFAVGTGYKDNFTSPYIDILFGEDISQGGSNLINFSVSVIKDPGFSMSAYQTCNPTVDPLIDNTQLYWDCFAGSTNSTREFEVSLNVGAASLPFSEISYVRDGLDVFKIKDLGGIVIEHGTNSSNGVDDGAFITCSTNSDGFRIFEVRGDVTTNATYIASLNGFASYSTLATNAVTPTGWTNTAGVNVSGYITATAVSFTINNRAGAVLYTSPTLTATLPVSLQNGWSLRAASGLVGTILPW